MSTKKKSPKTKKVVRNAGSGKFAKATKAKTAPKSHTTETVPLKKKKKPTKWLNG